LSKQSITISSEEEDKLLGKGSLFGDAAAGCIK